MAKRAEKTYEFQFGPDRLVEILTHPDYHVATEKALGALRVHVEPVTENDKQIIFQVHTVNFLRGLTGVDHSQTENAYVEYAWDLANKVARWTYTGRNPEKIDIWGNMLIEAQGTGSKLVSDFNIDVKIRIPLVSSRVEKKVLDGAQNSWRTIETSVNNFHRKLDEKKPS